MTTATRGTARMRSACTAAVAAGALTLLSALLPAPAGAAAPPTLWTKCPTGSAAGQCEIPRGIAADPNVPGHVYVANQGNSRIEEFTAWGQFVRAWGWGVRDGSAELQVCTAETGCLEGSRGPGPGQLAGGQGIAVDSEGDVYVTEGPCCGGNYRVQKFDLSGPQPAFEWMVGTGVNQGPNSPGDLCTAEHVAEGDTCGAGSEGAGPSQFGSWATVGSFIAIGPEDRVYVGDEERIQRFDAAGAYQDEIALPGEVVRSLAVDRFGAALYVATCTPGACGSSDVKPGVHKLSPAGASLGTLNVEEPYALSADAAGNVYVVDGRQQIGVEMMLRKFSPSGAEDAEFAFSDGFQASTGIAIGQACLSVGADLYVANIGRPITGKPHYVRAYGPHPDDPGCPPAPLAPEIADQYALSVDSSSAVVGAKINPNFWADATFYVQYGTVPCKTGPGACEEKPLAPGSPLGGGVTTDDVPASAYLDGLDPDATYHFRFVAQSSGGGPTFGIDPDGTGPQEASFEAGLEETFTTFPTPDAPNTDCPNQDFRVGASADLPDCRAYEMVSPLDKNGADIVLQPSSSDNHPSTFYQSSLEGEGLTYSSRTPFAGARSAPHTSQYLARRDPRSGWSTEALNAPRGSEFLASGRIPLDNEYKAFSPDLSSGWLVHYADPPLAPGALTGYINLYRRDNASGSFEALNGITPPNRPPGNGEETYRPKIHSVTADGSHAVFSANDKLTEDALAANVHQLYERRRGGALRLVSVLPDGSANPRTAAIGTGGGFDNRGDNTTHAVSEDGSRIFWTSSDGGRPPGPGQIYLRLDGERTIPVSQRVSAADARFWAADPAGSEAIFTVDGFLYSFDVETETPALIANGVQGVAGASEDLSRIYFASTGALAEGAAAGELNLYLYDEEFGIALIATLPKADSAAPNAVFVEPRYRTSRVSPDGRHLAFMSFGSLTGYDNSDVNSGQAALEVFRYAAATGELRCVSCNPSGARPAGRLISPENLSIQAWVAAKIRGAQNSFHAQRYLSDDGTRLYFEAYDALLPQDTNGKADVYQWEAPGKGDCDKGDADYFAENGGCLSLISSGTSPQDSHFIDATPDGSDVFFGTGSSLLSRDPGLVDAYDARVGGGFPVPEPPPPCEGEACQGASEPPSDPTPASASLVGAGNVNAGRGARCARPARAARRVAKRAKRATRAARRASRPGPSRRMRRKARRLGKRAGKLSKRAKRCRARQRGKANSKRRAQR